MLLGRWLNKRANEKSFEVHFWSVALTFAIINSTIDNSKSGGVVMSSIDLVILGIVLEKPQSAYDIQKDVEYHHLSRWTKISVPSIYRKVLQLSDKGYLQSDIVKGDKFADKAIYSITDQSVFQGADGLLCRWHSTLAIRFQCGHYQFEQDGQSRSVGAGFDFAPEHTVLG